jgi:hypothetical protein
MIWTIKAHRFSEKVIEPAERLFIGDNILGLAGRVNSKCRLEYRFEYAPLGAELLPLVEGDTQPRSVAAGSPVALIALARSLSGSKRSCVYLR